jgi:hypothetical protein
MWGLWSCLPSSESNLWDQLPVVEAIEPTAKPGWSVASRSHPAFAVSQFNSPEKTETYEILRHPEGRRKDVIRWAGPDQKPVAELEIYRPGGEISNRARPSPTSPRGWTRANWKWRD